MSKKILHIATFIVCSLAVNNVYAAGACKTNDCYCGLGIQDKRDTEKFLTTCYTAANKKVKTYDGYGDSTSPMKNCLEKCIGLDYKKAAELVKNPFSADAKKVLKVDPK